MAGTHAGGLKARDKNLSKDKEFYKRIGAIGGRNGTTGGFAANPELARIAGAKGGRISRRRPASEVSKRDAELAEAYYTAKADKKTNKKVKKVVQDEEVNSDAGDS